MPGRPDCALLLIAMLSVSQPARAGDETDYSAPYVTVENGELVTKYPAKEHAASVAGASQPVAEENEQDTSEATAVTPPEGGPAIYVALGFLLIALVGAALLLVRRRQRRASTAV